MKLYRKEGEGGVFGGGGGKFRSWGFDFLFLLDGWGNLSGSMLGQESCETS